MTELIWIIIGALSLGDGEPIPLTPPATSFQTKEQCEDWLSSRMLSEGYNLRRDINGDLVAFRYGNISKEVYRCSNIFKPE